MSYWMRIGVVGLGMGFLGCGAFGQAFPIRAIGEPVYPDGVEMEYFEWYAGTLERVGDLNGDGVDDLVVLFADSGGSASNRLMWLYIAEEGEDGSVWFGAPERIVGFDLEGGYISDFAIHDHDGDGLEDLIFATDQANDLEVWINSEDGFVVGMTLHSGVGGSGEGQRILIEDVDQDGDMDYLVCSHGHQCGIWTKQTNEDYSYEELQFYSEFGSKTVVSDVEGDGDLDLVAVDYSYLYSLKKVAEGWAIEGSASPFEATNFEVEYEVSTLADVNGDGMVDVVVMGWGDDEFGRTGWGFGFFLGPFDIGDYDDETGDNTEMEPREIPFFLIPEFENQYSERFQDIDRLYPEMLRSAGDLDGDGTEDLLYYPIEGKDWAWRISDPLNVNGRFGISPEMSIHGEGAIGLDGDMDPYLYAYRDTFIDVNGDGVKDRLVASVAERDVGIYQWNEEDIGLMVWAVLGNPFDKGVVVDEQDAIAMPSDSSHVVATDLDGDDDPEILVTVGSAIKLIDRNEEGNFAYNRDTRFIGNPVGFRTVVASLDGDETPDVLSLDLNRNAQAPSIFLNPVAGLFGETVRNFDVDYDPDLYEVLDELGITFDGFDNSFAVGDVNGDEILDVVIRGAVWIEDGYSGESVLTWINDGVGGLSFGSILPIRQLSGVRTFNMELVDANNDGLMDVVSVGDEGIEEGYVLGLYINDGAGGYSLAQEIVIHDGFGLQPYWMEIEDLDGDGYQDVMVLLKNNDDLHEIAVVYGMGSGLAGEAVYFAGGNAAEVLAVDLDGNGLRDLLTCSYQSGGTGIPKRSVSIVFQVEPRVFLPIVSIDDLDLSGVNVADMNGDGVLDLVACTNRTSGEDIDDLVRVFYSVPGVCVADLNLDGVLDYFDVSLFVKLLGERREIVDLSGDGEFNALDISVFLDAFGDGCGGGNP